MPNKFKFGDPHLMHENIIKWSRQQFKTVDEHDECIISNINQETKPEDTLVLMGDVFFGTDTDKANHLLSQIHCKMELVVGNHDTHHKIKMVGHHFKKIHTCYDMHFRDKKVLVMHYPVHEQQFQKRYMAQIHAHTHDVIMTKKVFRTTTWDGKEHTAHFDEVPDERYICVSAEQLDLKPISMDEIHAKLAKLY